MFISWQCLLVSFEVVIIYILEMSIMAMPVVDDNKRPPPLPGSMWIVKINCRPTRMRRMINVLRSGIRQK